jgi:hypothetical protein
LHMLNVIDMPLSIIHHFFLAINTWDEYSSHSQCPVLRHAVTSANTNCQLLDKVFPPKTKRGSNSKPTLLNRPWGVPSNPRGEKQSAQWHGRRSGVHAPLWLRFPSRPDQHASISMAKGIIMLAYGDILLRTSRVVRCLLNQHM